MENIFSNKTHKRVPQTLFECTQPDPTATNLHLWAERLENWGHILFCIIVFAGIFLSFSAALTAADEARYNEETSAFFSAFTINALLWALCAFLEYCTYHCIALLISALACITQNTIVTADIALFTALQQTGDATNSPSIAHLPDNANFVCPKCNHPVQKGESACCNCGQPLGWDSVP